MQLYNTLTKSVEPFLPLTSGEARIYSCGPTVYDHAHIGNLRAFIAADVLRRTLVGAGLHVHHAMNFTDVDDKMIARSQELYPSESPEHALSQLGRQYEQVFRDDLLAIGNDLDSLDFIRATDSIAAMQQLITDLYTAGIAYIADDGVYFSIKAYKKAGKKYGQLTEISTESTSESRINNDEYDKTSAHDFALWKTRKPNEPAWEYELDGHDLLGRPGWHIECSAMSVGKLGQPFDIHTGGIDLIFPHHENEIAQSTAITDNPVYAQFFVHNEHLLVEGRKMSKSLQNFYTLQDVIEHHIDPMAFRMLTLQAHYRTQLNFSWENLEAAEIRLNRWRNVAVLRYQASATTNTELAKAIADAIRDAQTALQNDLDTPAALTVIEKVFDAVEAAYPKIDTSFEQLLDFIDQQFGLDLQAQPDISAEAAEVLQAREAARIQHDYDQADALRTKLLESGYTVRDTTHGQIWGRSPRS